MPCFNCGFKYGPRVSRKLSTPETLVLRCPVCGDERRIPVIQPTLEQLVGEQKATQIQAARAKPLEIRYYGINGRVLGRLK